jgi:hypothetical protein
MSEFVFSPPLKLVPRITVRTLSDAVAYVRTCPGVRRPFIQAAIQQSMSKAVTVDQQRFCAKGFRLWAEAEGYLLGEEIANPG